MKKKFAKLSKNALLLLFSVFLSLAFIEGVLRYFNYPVQSLRSKNIYDDILHYRIPSDYPGVDKNGFRNPEVMSHADIVTLGDSHTYGYNVDIDNTWPRYISKMTGKTVYNFGMAGFGPLQYYYLFNRALEMTPTHIIIGLNVGNGDLRDMCQLFLKSAFWKEHSKEEGLDLEYCYDTGDISWTEEIVGPLERFRKSSRIAALVRIAKSKWIWLMNPSPKKYIIINDDRNKILIKKRKLKISRELMDLRQKEITNGLRITKIILYRIAKRSQRNNTKFVVLLIPSKIMALYNYLLRRHPDLPSEYHEWVSDRWELKSMLTTFLAENQIAYVDALPYVEQALYSSGNVYPPYEGHPLAAGYHAYAAALYNEFWLKQNNSP